jgi:dTMP kinase
VESFRLFQARILEEYERIIDEFDVGLIDATHPITDQQRQVREFVRPLLNGCLRIPDEPHAGRLRELGVAGRYLKELRPRLETCTIFRSNTSVAASIRGQSRKSWSFLALRLHLR